MNSFGAPFLVDNNEAILKDARIQAATPVEIPCIPAEQYWATASSWRN
jgi:hypothetical protein